MPVNKSARIRYEIIEACLSNPMQKWTRGLLLEIVNEKLLLKFDQEGISASMLRKDMEAMESVYGAPIDSRQDGKYVYYYYEDPEFSISNIPLEEMELLVLNQAVHLLKQIKGFTISEEIADIVKKLEKKIRLEIDSTSVIAFENPPSPKGIDFLEDIFIAILNNNGSVVF